MKFRNFTGLLPNFTGGFSGGSATESPGILWDINTYKLGGSFTTTGSGETAPTGMWFKPDGTKLYIVGQTQDRIKSWDLTTPWDIATATNLFNMANTLNDTGGVALTNPTAISFSDNGLFAFVTDQTNNALYRYNLTTAWDLSTINATASQANTTIYTGNLSPQSIWVRPDGLMFVTANSGTTSQYRTFTTAVANDITTLTLGTSASGGSTPVGAVWADNGGKFVFVVQSTDTIFVNTYSGAAYTFTGPTLLSSRVMTAQDTTPQDVYMKNDGSAFYYLGSATDTIYQFTLN